MIGLGLGHNFSLGFAHLGSIRRASMELDKATRGITENIETKRHYFNTYLNIELSKLKGQYNNRRYDSDKLVIYRDTENLNLTRKMIESNSLTPSQLGYVVKYAGKVLNDKEAEYILLVMFVQQTAQINHIINMNRITSGMMKRLKPDIALFDKSYLYIRELHGDNGIFTEESLNRLFNEDRVYKTFIDIISDLGKQLDSLFIERSPGFKSIINTFDNYFEDSNDISEKILMNLTLRAYIANFMNDELNDPNINEEYKEEIREIRQMLYKSFTSQNVYKDKSKNLEYLKTQYPNNEFCLY